jgi:DnaJ-class molecular chaperone
MSAQQRPRPCTRCNGTGGQVETTTTDGVMRQTWHSCTTCHGTGRA